MNDVIKETARREQEQETGRTSEQRGVQRLATMCERTVVLHGGRLTLRDAGGHGKRDGNQGQLTWCTTRQENREWPKCSIGFWMIK